MNDPNTLILSSLAHGDKHGYAIMEDVEQFAGVKLGPGTLYGAIARLEASGWIRPLAGEARRRPYGLTAEGAAELGRQMEAMERVAKVGLRRLRARRAV